MNLWIISISHSILLQCKWMEIEQTRSNPAESPKIRHVEIATTSRVTADCAGALRDGANVVRTETGNDFCVRICYKFLISDCRGDLDLGLCTFWVLVKSEPLSKSDSRKNAFRPQKNSNFAIAQRIYKRKHPKSAQTSLSVSSTFSYYELIANSHGKRIS